MREIIEKILDAVEFTSASSLSFSGRQIAVETGSNTNWHPLVKALQQELYAHCFIHPFGQNWSAPAEGSVNAENFIPTLSRANMSCDRWDPLWQITHLMPNGRIQVFKNGWTRRLWPGEFLTATGPGIPPQIGSMVTIHVPRESSTMQPGFYFAFGESLTDMDDDQTQLVRFYFGIKDVAAPTLLTLATTSLNQFQVPFRLKCLSQQSLFPRLDAAVLYVHRKFFSITSRMSLEIARRIGDFMHAQTPLFTRQLAPGVSISEDPGMARDRDGNIESFGTQRCRLFAEGIVNNHFAGRQTLAARVDGVADHFHANGFELNRCFLNPGSADIYEIAGQT